MSSIWFLQWLVLTSINVVAFCTNSHLCWRHYWIRVVYSYIWQLIAIKRTVLCPLSSIVTLNTMPRNISTRVCHSTMLNYFSVVFPKCALMFTTCWTGPCAPLSASCDHCSADSSFRSNALVRQAFVTCSALHKLVWFRCRQSLATTCKYEGVLV